MNPRSPLYAVCALSHSLRRYLFVTKANLHTIRISYHNFRLPRTRLTSAIETLLAMRFSSILSKYPKFQTISTLIHSTHQLSFYSSSSTNLFVPLYSCHSYHTSNAPCITVGIILPQAFFSHSYPILYWLTFHSWKQIKITTKISPDIVKWLFLLMVSSNLDINSVTNVNKYMK